MTNNFLHTIFYVLFTSAFLMNEVFAADPAPTQPSKKESSEQEDTLSQFKETKFLQIDQLDIPKELSRIAEQIRQNAMDVVINSKTHTPVYAQKREAGYSDSYKKFHGLEIQIVPIPGEEDFYSLNFFYYNWTNRKFDKRLRKRISKYNVLNEMRFGLYELLLGKKFVDEHRDELEKQNYDRIQAVRENEEQQGRIERKKKKLEKKQKEEEEHKRSLIEEKKRNLLSRGDDPDKENRTKLELKPVGEKGQNSSPSGITQKDPDEEDDQKIETPDINESQRDKVERKKKKKGHRSSKSSPPEKEVMGRKLPLSAPAASNPEADVEGRPLNEPEPFQEPPVSNVKKAIPSNSRLYVFGSLFDGNVIADGFLHSETTLRYIGGGARYILEEDLEKPRGMRFTLKMGLPLKKDKYAIPVYRAFESEVYKKKLYKHYQLLGGLDFSPIYFVNLATAGEGLKVFENDIFWIKGGVAYNNEFMGKEFDLRAILLKSLLVQSNQKKKIDGISLVFSSYCQIANNHGAEIAFQKSTMVGDLSVTAQSIYFSYVYKFEN